MRIRVAFRVATGDLADDHRQRIVPAESESGVEDAVQRNR
jgi:hypothetical protein